MHEYEECDVMKIIEGSAVRNTLVRRRQTRRDDQKEVIGR